MRVQVETGQAATLELIPTQGVPTSASIEVLDEDGGELIGEKAATIDSFEEAVTEDQSRDGRELTVQDASDMVVGRPYWLQTDGGAGYEIIPFDKTDTLVKLRGGLRFAITGGETTIYGIRITYDLTAEDTAEEQRPAEAIWRWVVGCVSYSKRMSFDIVEKPFDIDVPEHRIEKAESLFGETLGGYVPTDQLVDQARRDVWRALKELFVQKIDEEVLHRDILEDAMVWQVLFLRHMDDEARAPVFAKHFERCIKAAMGPMRYRGSSSSSSSSTSRLISS